MWFIVLLVLAVAAVLIIKAVKAHSERQASAADEPALTSGIQGSLRRSGATDPTDSTPVSDESSPAATAVASTPADPDSPMPDSSSTLNDIREMIKTLNLTDSDSPRLGISRDEFNALRNRENADPSTLPLPDSTSQADIAERLRRMLN